MGNIAGALESPRFTTLPRPSHSDAIYLPNCSSDAFITLLDLSPYNKKKKKQRTKFLHPLLSPLDGGGGEGARGERGAEPCGSGLCGAGNGARGGLVVGFLSWQRGGSEQASPPELGEAAPLPNSLPRHVDPALGPTRIRAGAQGMPWEMGLGCKATERSWATECVGEAERFLPPLPLLERLSRFSMVLFPLVLFFFSCGPLFSGFSKPGAKPERGHLCLGAAEPRVLGLCVRSRLLAALPAPLAARSCLKTRLPLSTLHSKHCAKVQAGAVDAVHQCASCRPAGPVRAVQGWEVK